MLARLNTAVLIGGLSVSLTAGAASSAWDQYQSIAKQAYNGAKTAPMAKLKQQGVELVGLAEKMLPEFVQANPQCKVYLNAALKAKGDMLSTDLKSMERDYHADGKLPQLTDGSCYHAKDLLVHAASVVVLANEKLAESEKREHIEHELDEVLEHFQLVKNALKK